MKDAHGHGSDGGGGAAHQSGVHALGRTAMDFARDESGGGKKDPHEIASDIMTSHIGEHMLFNPDVVAHFSHLFG